ncbi:aminodeoxychorismate lyase [Thiomicrorhabdus sp. zzn3]|uniref:aminodeoxychorismate lyase n=1 Tax=Thiomicrorhabdus sp. zzn3 TaxID=3039775 RepID=UPI0024366922|nr:aminodeoxychorismate lyase [Thiomicrorhabdus sp. zzn3]MDG6778281.1 aminodeoxychorismate lyase [Thiomicrorhabdus sp. zzn3]
MAVETVFTWVDGQPQNQIEIADRALQYGDGFFTTMLVSGNRLFNWSAHWRRLQSSAERLGFATLDEVQALSLLRPVLQKAVELRPTQPFCVLKIIVSRGAGGIGYQPPAEAVGRVIIQLMPHPLFRTENELRAPLPPIDAMICQTQAGIQPQLAGMKHLNRLENVLARAELAASAPPFFGEGIMLNADEEVISGTQSNVFVIQGQTMLTPPLTRCGVEGTTRYQLQFLAKHLGLVWQEQRLTLQHLQDAPALFFSNAVRGIMPVQHLVHNGVNVATYEVEAVVQIQQAWSDWQNDNALEVAL